MSRLLGYDADGMPLAVDDPEHDRIVEETMGEITAGGFRRGETQSKRGDRVWVQCVFDGGYNPFNGFNFSVGYEIPDHPALPAVAAALHANPALVSVLLTAEEWGMVIDSMRQRWVQAVHDTADKIDAQLAAHRGEAGG